MNDPISQLLSQLFKCPQQQFLVKFATIALVIPIQEHWTLFWNKYSLPISSSTTFTFCNSSCSNKVQCFSFLSLISTAPLQILVSDFYGPSPLSLDKNWYYCVFIDQYTKYIWLYTLKNKYKVRDIFSKFHPSMEKQFKRTIVSLYTDGGGEYKIPDQYLNINGIEHLVSPHLLHKEWPWQSVTIDT